jgi:hypothetical protein
LVDFGDRVLLNNSLLDSGVHVRKMEDADVEVCNELNVKAIDFGREQEIRIMIRVGNAWVLIRDGEIMYVLSPH